MHPKSVVIPGWNKLDARWCQTQREAYLSATTIRHVPRNSPCRETTTDSVSEKARAGVGGVHGDDGSRDTADARSNRDLSETDDTVSDDDVLEAILMTDSELEETDADPDDTDKDDDPTWDPNHAHTSKTSTTAIDDDDDSETEEEDVERKGEIARPAANAAGGNIAPPSASRQDASGGTVGILVEGGGKSRRKSEAGLALATIHRRREFQEHHRRERWQTVLRYDQREARGREARVHVPRSVPHRRGSRRGV